MKWNKLQITFLIALLSLGTIMLAPTRVSASVSPYSPSEAISINPSSKIYESATYCTYNNTEFTVEVLITNITGCAGYQFQVDYNSTLLSLDSWTFDTDPDNPLSPTQMAPSEAGRVDTDILVAGSIKLATVWKSGQPIYTYSGDSVAARITFKIVYCPPQVVMEPQVNTTVWSNISFNQAWTRAVDDLGDDILFSTFNNGYYEYTTIGKTPERPTADFDWTPTYPYEGGEATFTDQSLPNGGTINAWLWQVVGPASNTTSMEGPVMILYFTDGGYVNITLTVWDTEGANDSKTEQIYVIHRGRATLFVHPPSSTILVGETFKIGIIINNVIDLYSFELKLCYNTTVLDVVSVWTMWPGDLVMNETTGLIWANAQCPYPYPFSGNGTLAFVTFTAIGLGNSFLDLQDTNLVDFYTLTILHDALDGSVEIIPVRDVAVVNVTPSPTRAYPTWIQPINVTVMARNEGSISETFNVAVYHNLTGWVLIGNQTVFNLAAGANETLTFNWNITGLPVGLYAINATASATDEVDVEDNTQTSTVKLNIPGDVDGDDDVDVGDQRKMQIALFSVPGSHNWNPYADIDGDLYVDVGDQRTQQLHMFETWP